MVGAVVLIAAMAGVFFYERAQFETYEVSWEPREAEAASESGTLDEGDSDSYTFEAETERLSSVTVSVAWSDDVGQADTFEVDVEGAGDEYADTAEADASPLEIEIPVREQPEASTATGRSMEEARDQLNASASWTDGTGEWTVSVTLVEAPGQQIGGQEMAEDGSQAYELSFVQQRWEPVLEPGP